MEKNMNKNEFVNQLVKQTNYSDENCLKITNILENYFLIGKNNKNKIIKDLMTQLMISNEEADELYNISTNIITTQIKRKIIHPFKNQK